ncbi:unnamed protein product [Prorocentrum cordatum]|uniref:Uncharacterized protein n=3 Tax=Prorocentrum cordatum TaxID=2364126 RepID=A0ABN9XTH1_9DINO|nr:unnamed protein product [Polarella glacialis]
MPPVTFGSVHPVGRAGDHMHGAAQAATRQFGEAAQPDLHQQALATSSSGEDTSVAFLAELLRTAREAGSLWGSVASAASAIHLAAPDVVHLREALTANGQLTWVADYGVPVQVPQSLFPRPLSLEPSGHDLVKMLRFLGSVDRPRVPLDAVQTFLGHCWHWTAQDFHDIFGEMLRAGSVHLVAGFVQPGPVRGVWLDDPLAHCMGDALAEKRFGNL